MRGAHQTWAAALAVAAIGAQRRATRNTKPAEHCSLWAVGCVVDERETSSVALWRCWGECYAHRALRSDFEAGTARVGLLKSGSRPDALDSQCGRTLVAQVDRLFRARVIDILATEVQLARGQRRFG